MCAVVATSHQCYHQVNKGIHPDELAMYNSFYGDDREFMPIYIDERGQYQHDNGGDATEVLLDLDEGQQWGANSTHTLTVAEVRTDAGKGRKGTFCSGWLATTQKLALAPARARWPGALWRSAACTSVSVPLRKFLLAMLVAAPTMGMAETVSLGGTDYEVVTVTVL